MNKITCATCGREYDENLKSCPLCGTPNEFLNEEQEERVENQAAKDWEEKENQKSQTRGKGGIESDPGFATRISIIAMLVLCILACGYYLGEGSYRMHRKAVEKDINQNYAKYKADLDNLEAEGLWQDLAYYYDAIDLSYSDRFREYNMVLWTAKNYETVENTILRIRSDPYCDYEYSYSLIARQMEEFYKRADRTEYKQDWYDESYQQVHVDAMAQMKVELEAELATYFNLPLSTVQTFNQLSVNKIGAILEEGGSALYGKETEDH